MNDHIVSIMEKQVSCPQLTQIHDYHQALL